LTVAVGVINKAFVGFPKGYDAYGHMSKVKFLVENFPNSDWNSEWYSGQFFSEGSFPPLFHDLAAILVAWFGVSVAESLVLIAAASFVVIAAALYGVVRVLGGSKLAALIAAMLLLATSSFWSYVLVSGLYPRILGMAFVAVFVLCAALYRSRRSRFAYVAMITSLAGALSAHLLLGAVAVALGLLIVAFVPVSGKSRFVDAVLLLIPTALVVAYFYLPYALSLSRPGPVPLLTREYAAMSPVDALGGRTVQALPVFMLPVAVIAVAAAFRFRRLPPTRVGVRFIPLMAIAAAAALTYALVGLPTPHQFIYNFQPGQALFFAAWFLALILGLALIGLRLPRWSTAGIALVLVGVVVLSPTRITDGVVNGDNPDKTRLQAALHIDPSDQQHRVGVSWDDGSDWINARYAVPQTRGYQQQGVVEANWQYWLETRLWSANANYGEKNFLLDWYAIRAFYGGPDPRVLNSFAARPDLYQLQDPTGLTFNYLEATQVLSARTTRTAIVIGSDSAYSDVMRALSLTDFDSRSLIPLRGGPYIDDHSASELREFDLVILYDYQVRDLGKSFRMLNSYVQGGGALFIEANNSPLADANQAPAPIPGSSIRVARIGPDWNLTTGSSQVTEGVNLGSFAPAVYNGGAWGISYIPEAAINSWAQPVLLSDGRPVVVAGTLGAGRVVWSGMNLPYHAASTRNVAESRLLANAISWAAPAASSAPTFQADFVNPELRKVTVTSPAKGVLLKESWVPNWQASVNGHLMTIYRAGPDFMYVPVRNETGTVQFEFTRTAVEWAGDAISIAAVVGLIWWLAEPWIRRRPLRRLVDRLGPGD
jgi:uncharacterized protein DUF6541